MAVTPKYLGGATLNSTLTTSIYTCPSATTTRVEHIIISNGSTAGTVTVSISRSGTARELLNARSISANGIIELFNIILEAGDILQAGATTTTGAKITLFGSEAPSV